MTSSQQPEVAAVPTAVTTSRAPVTRPHDLPAVIDVMTAAGVLRIGRTAAYELVRTNRWPTPIIRVDGRIKIPSAPLLDLVCLSTDPAPDLANDPPTR